MLKTVADDFGKDKRKSEKKIFRLDRFLSKKAEDPVEMLGAGEFPMDDLPMEKEVEPAPDVSPMFLDVKPITKKYDGIDENVVVFSGGFDSTLILVDLLEKGIKPRLLTFRCKQFGEARHFTSEIAAQENILEYLAKNYNYEPKRNYLTLEGDIIDWNGTEPHLFQQPFMLSMVSMCGRNNACYHFGYHRGDDFWHSSHNILAAQEHLLAVTGQKNIMFSFPLQFLTKADIIRKLNRYHFPTELCTFCYSPSYKGRCGKCVACQTYEKAMSEIVHLAGTDRGIYGDLYYPEGFIEQTRQCLMQEYKERM